MVATAVAVMGMAELRMATGELATGAGEAIMGMVLKEATVVVTLPVVPCEIIF